MATARLKTNTLKVFQLIHLLKCHSRNFLFKNGDSPYHLCAASKANMDSLKSGYNRARGSKIRQLSVRDQLPACHSCAVRNLLIESKNFIIRPSHFRIHFFNDSLLPSPLSLLEYFLSSNCRLNMIENLIVNKANTIVFLRKPLH